MQNNPTWILVVALALFDAEGRVLLQQRPSHKHHGGLWEFPGGKVENGENPAFALCREIAEELALTLDAALLEPSFFAEEVGSPTVVLNLYTSRQEVTEPVATEGQTWGWHALVEAGELPLAPMDRQLLEKLNGRGKNRPIGLAKPATPS